MKKPRHAKDGGKRLVGILSISGSWKCFKSKQVEPNSPEGYRLMKEMFKKFKYQSVDINLLDKLGNKGIFTAGGD